MELFILIIILLIILKIKYDMSDIQSVIAAAESENQTISQLSSVITLMASHYAGFQQQIAALTAQISGDAGVVSKKQLDVLSQDIADGQKAASDALAAAQAALNPPVADPTPTPDPTPEPDPSTGGDAPVVNPSNN